MLQRRAGPFLIHGGMPRPTDSRLENGFVWQNALFGRSLAALRSKMALFGKIVFFAERGQVEMRLLL